MRFCSGETKTDGSPLRIVLRDAVNEVIYGVAPAAYCCLLSFVKVARCLAEMLPNGLRLRNDYGFTSPRNRCDLMMSRAYSSFSPGVVPVKPRAAFAAPVIQARVGAAAASFLRLSSVKQRLPMPSKKERSKANCLFDRVGCAACLDWGRTPPFFVVRPYLLFY